VLRAVECRTPVVVAANTGISASIDGSGRVLARGPKRATASLRSEVRPDGRQSPFLLWGTLPTGLTVLAAGTALAAAGIPRRLERAIVRFKAKYPRFVKVAGSTVNRSRRVDPPAD